MSISLFLKTFKNILSLVTLASILISFSIIQRPVPVAAKIITETYTCQIPLTTTDWITGTGNLSHCSLPKFNTNQGKLNKVTVGLASETQSSIRLENLDNLSHRVTFTANSAVTLRRPDNSDLIRVFPSVTITEDFAAYDGPVPPSDPNFKTSDIDYDGPSGQTYPVQRATLSDTFVATTQEDLDLFSATTDGENILLPANAVGMSNDTGSANLAKIVITSASALATVQYEYEATDLAIQIATDEVITINKDERVNVKVTNNDTSPSPVNSIVSITLPPNTEYIGISNAAYPTELVNGILRVTLPEPIPTGEIVDFDVTIKVNEATTETLNFPARVDPTLADYVPADNTTTTTAETNYRPQATAQTINLSVNNGLVQKLPLPSLGTDLDGQPDITTYNLQTVFDTTKATLYLGNPDTGGTIVAPDTALTPADLNNLYAKLASTIPTTTGLDYTLIDSQNDRSITSGTLTLNTTYTPPVVYTSAPTTSSNNSQLDITLQSGSVLTVGQNQNLNVKLTNNSSVTDTNVKTVQITLPSDVEFLGVSNPSYLDSTNGSTITLKVPDRLNAGQSLDFNLQVKTKETDKTTATTDANVSENNTQIDTTNLNLPINHAPETRNTTSNIDLDEETTIYSLANNFEAFDKEENKTELKYQIQSVNSGSAKIYLGKPNQGRLLSSSQTLSYGELSNLYVEISDQDINSVSINFQAIDKYGVVSTNTGTYNVNFNASEEEEEAEEETEEPVTPTNKPTTDDKSTPQTNHVAKPTSGVKAKPNLVRTGDNKNSSTANSLFISGLLCLVMALCLSISYFKSKQEQN